jgi:putative transposase
VPWGLRRYQEANEFHFVTFSCYGRKPKLGAPECRDLFERSLERVQLQYGLYVAGYVVMPEHVHLLVSEPEGELLSKVLQSLKQSVSRRLGLRTAEPFWLERYYDFNVFTEEKRVEKLRYMHRNPVVRGFVSKPEEWAWSSFRHYLTGVEGVVEIESEWTAGRRRRDGVVARPLRFRGENPP